jgi:hypothetical protein
MLSDCSAHERMVAALVDAAVGVIKKMKKMEADKLDAVMQVNRFRVEHLWVKYVNEHCRGSKCSLEGRKRGLSCSLLLLKCCSSGLEDFIPVAAAAATKGARKAIN